MALKYDLELKHFRTFQYIAVKILLWEIEILVLFNTKYHWKKQPITFQIELKNVTQPLQHNLISEH